MVKRSANALQGMAEIRAYVNRSEATVMRWIRELGFPARKILGGLWESDKGLIDRWRAGVIQSVKADEAAVEETSRNQPEPAVNPGLGRRRQKTIAV